MSRRAVRGSFAPLTDANSWKVFGLSFGTWTFYVLIGLFLTGDDVLKVASAGFEWLVAHSVIRIVLASGIIAFLHREVAQSLLATLTSPKRTNP